MKQFKIWRSVTIGKKPSTKGIKISSDAKDMLKKVKWNKKETIDLVLLQVKDLGINAVYPTTQQIFDKAQELGLSLCPPQVGLQLRVDYQDQPLNEWIYIMMEPIAGRYGHPGMFGAGRGG